MIVPLKAMANPVQNCKNDSPVVNTPSSRLLYTLCWKHQGVRGSRLRGGEYTGEWKLPGGEYTGESPLKSSNSLIIVLKSKLFLRLSNGPGGAVWQKNRHKKSRDTIPLTSRITELTRSLGTYLYPRTVNYGWFLVTWVEQRFKGMLWFCCVEVFGNLFNKGRSLIRSVFLFVYEVHLKS
jgi:hypothetical protein